MKFYKLIPFVTALMVFSCSPSQNSANPGDKTVHVTGVSLDYSELTLIEGETQRLVATVNPDNATDKTITWTSTNQNYVKVDQNGLVTAVSKGTAAIIATSKDKNKTAKCTVKVTPTASGLGSFAINVTEFTTGSYEENNKSHESQCSHENPISWTSYNVMQRNGCMQWRRNSGYIYNTTPVDGLAEMSISTSSAGSFTGAIYSGTSANPTTNSATISNGTTYKFPEGVNYFKIAIGGTTGYCGNISISHNATEVEPTAISIESSAQIAAGRNKTLTVEYTPSNANKNKQISWSRVSGDSDISVDSKGSVSVASTASIGDTAVIQAKLTNLQDVPAATCSVSVIEQTKDAWTVMMYVSGSNLESEGGAATADMSEVLSIENQPEDVNILYQTGGTTKWYSVNSDKSLDKSKVQRWEVRDGQLKWKADLPKVNSKIPNMAASSTLEDYIKWGVKNYPAEKYAVIFWDHGGAMEGVCIDDNHSSSYNYDYLTNSETKQALTNVFNDSSLGLTGKFEFVGYDACLMQVQDIAEFNSQFFNYMVASEQLENGDGWDYTCWIDDLYAKKSTSVILTELCEGFVDQYGTKNNDQTQSWLDLSAMSAFKTAWENMAASLKNNIKTYENNGYHFYSFLISKVKYFGDRGDYNELGVFDTKDFLNQLKNNSTLYNGLSNLVSNVETAFSNLVKCSKKGNSAGNAYGLMFYFDTGSYCNPGTLYSTSQTNFTNWRSIVNTYGYNAIN